MSLINQLVQCTQMPFGGKFHDLSPPYTSYCDFSGDQVNFICAH